MEATDFGDELVSFVVEVQFRYDITFCHDDISNESTHTKKKNSSGACNLSRGRKFGKLELWPLCNSFVWLASLNRCWTADRLAHRSVDHLGNIHCVIKRRRMCSTCSLYVCSQEVYGSQFCPWLACSTLDKVPMTLFSPCGGFKLCRKWLSNIARVLTH